jgi:hypothetical protein
MAGVDAPNERMAELVNRLRLAPTRTPYAVAKDALAKITIYTSLESCAQCAGIMALAGIPRVVYMQRDPGQQYIGNILRNLQHPEPPLAGQSILAPLPTDAEYELGFTYSRDLNRGYAEYKSGVIDGMKPFFKDPHPKPGDNGIDASTSVASFLCTDLALNVFKKANDELFSLATLKRPEYKGMSGRKDALSNRELVGYAQEYVARQVGEIGKTRR